MQRHHRMCAGLPGLLHGLHPSSTLHMLCFQGCSTNWHNTQHPQSAC